MAKILLVEDDKSLREIYGVRLIAEGYEIVSAGDGEEALAMAIKERPDLIVSDVMMPKISGFDMLDILRSTTETKNVKVIMMTALSSEDQRARGEALGADRYLVKSQVGIEDVVRTVHDVLGDGTAPAAPAPAYAAPVPVAPIAVPVAAPTPVAPEPATPVAAVIPPAPTPVIPEPVATPQPIAPVATPAPAPTPAPVPVPEPFQAPAPVYAAVPPAPVYEQPVPSAPTPAPVAAAPVAPVYAPAPTPVIPEPVATPQPIAPVASPVAAAPAPAPAPAPVPASVPVPEPTAMPQPTAPFSTAAPASLGERVIAPLSDYSGSAGLPDLSSEIAAALNGTETQPTQNTPPTV